MQEQNNLHQNVQKEVNSKSSTHPVIMYAVVSSKEDHIYDKRFLKKQVVVDEDHAWDQVYNSLFRRGPISPSLLNDDDIFEQLEKGLNEQEVEWIRDKRDALLDKAEASKLKRMQNNTIKQNRHPNVNSTNCEAELNQEYTDAGKRSAVSLKFKPERLSFENKTEKYFQASKIKEERIQTVRRMKEDILEKRRREIKLKIINREYRAKMFSTEMLDALSGTWIQQNCLNAIAHSITQKFELRRVTRERVLKLGRSIWWILRSVGMFMVRIKKARYKVAERKISHFVRIYWLKWLDKRKQKKAKIIYEFLKFTKYNRGKVDLKWMKYYNTISKVQKRVKAYLARRALRYAILNGRWNQIEHKYYRQSVKESDYVAGVHKNIVPIKIRKIYFREYLRFLRIDYIKGKFDRC